MARQSAVGLKSAHPGADIWVIASGPSAGFVDPSFFEGKITIGVNRVWTRFETTYIVVKESAVLQLAIDDGAGAIVIASRHNCGNLSNQESRARGEFYYFAHQENHLEQVDLDVIGTDKIVVSFSTITSAMHLAAYMGAKNILLVGHDCGSIDGKINFDGYPDNLMRSESFYRDFLARIEPQSLQVRARLEQVFGCNIYSLNPFINLGMEDHKYEQEKSN
jgi:hypothetical protein